MFETIAPALRSGILKQGALGFAAKAQGFSVGVGSCEVRVELAPEVLGLARDIGWGRTFSASMKALSFGLEAQSSLLQFCESRVRAQVPTPRQ